MTKAEAISKACKRNEDFGSHYVVIERIDHPQHFGEPVYMLARERELHTLSAGSRVVFATNPCSRWIAR